MSEKKEPDGELIGESAGLPVAQLNDGRVGALREFRDGENMLGREVFRVNTSNGELHRVDMTEIAATSSGVVTESYRSGWDRIFGKETN